VNAYFCGSQQSQACLRFTGCRCGGRESWECDRLLCIRDLLFLVLFLLVFVFFFLLFWRFILLDGELGLLFVCGTGLLLSVVLEV
jgi:hypothetical protein